MYMQVLGKKRGDICTCRFEVRQEGVYVHAGLR